MQSFERVIVTTTTFYEDPSGNDKVRFDLACELVRLAIGNGHIVVIVDGSPACDVGEKLKNIGAHVFTQSEKGMGAARRQVWIEAGKLVTPDIAAILWTEEKPDIIRSLAKMVPHIREQNAQAVIPSRSLASWETYPDLQRGSEQIANLVYNKLFPSSGVCWDPMFGPVCFHPDALAHFTGINPTTLGLPDTYVQHYAPVYMRYLGLKVDSIEVDFIYPPGQRDEEEREKIAEMSAKRLWQMTQLITAYFAIYESFDNVPP